MTRPTDSGLREVLALVRRVLDDDARSRRAVRLIVAVAVAACVVLVPLVLVVSMVAQAALAVFGAVLFLGLAGWGARRVAALRAAAAKERPAQASATSCGQGGEDATGAGAGEVSGSAPPR